MTDIAEQYVVSREETGRIVADLKKETNRLSVGRLVSFGIGICMIVVGAVDSKPVFLGVGLIFMAAFIAFVIKSSHTNDKLDYYNALNEVYDRYVKRFSDKWMEFEDDGAELLDEAPNYIKEVSLDLDLLGEGSLFQYINVGASMGGKKALYKALTLAFDDQNEEDGNKLDKQFMVSDLAIYERQEAVKELLYLKDLSYKLEALAIKAKRTFKKAMNSDRVELEEETKGSKKFAVTVCVVASLMTACAWVSAILSLFNVVSAVVPTCLFVAMFVISQFLDGTFIGNSYEAFPCLDFLAAYEPYFQIVAGAEFESEALLRAQKEIKKDADKGIRGLRIIGAAMRFRANPLVYGLLCTACFYNAYIYLGFVRWKLKYEKRVNRWIDAVAEIEMFLSLAVVGRVKRKYTFPRIVEDAVSEVAFVNMCHPLINESRVVGNDCSMKNNLLIITGSNMSGKTTYLRTLGVNVVLSYAGSAVAADKASLSVMRMFTSMRVMDDVSNGISSFYAEVLRIKTITGYIGKNMPMLVLIDEIFKGTNSADRIIGAKGVIGTLAKPWITGMITTHDFELCALADDHDRIINYHFDEYFEGDELKFEYKLKPDRCTTTNALHILKMAGVNVNTK